MEPNEVTTKLKEFEDVCQTFDPTGILYNGAYAVFAQGFSQEAKDSLDSDKIFSEKSGRAVLRTRGGQKETPGRAVNNAVDSLEGEKFYERPNGEKYFTRKWGEHSDVEVLRKAREDNFYALLYGAPGCGKTAMVEGAFGDSLYTILGSGDTEVADLVGGYVQTPAGGFEWVDGPLVKSAEEGKVLLIDEIGLIDPKVLAVVYGLMDGRRELVVTANPERGVVRASEGFYVVAATNPNAPGVRLSEALLSRFALQVEMTTDWLLAKKLGVPAPAVTASQNLSRKQESGEVSWAPQFRELLAFRDISTTYGTQFAISNLIATAPEMDRPIVADVFTRVFGDEYKPARI
jgi:nitric oxide reductase NorQ protein